MISFSSFIQVFLPKKLSLKMPIQTLIKATETELELPVAKQEIPSPSHALPARDHFASHPGFP
jgi:hypothetical protein